MKGKETWPQIGQWSIYLSLDQLRWLTVVVPPLLIGIFEFARHSTVLETIVPIWLGNLAEMALVMFGTVIFSRWIFGTIEHLVGENEQRRLGAEALLEVGTEVTTLLERDRILQSLVDHARRLVSSDAAILCLAQHGNVTGTEIAASSGVSPEQVETMRLRLGESLPAERAILTGQPAFAEWAPAPAGPVRCSLAVPLRVADHVVGSLCVGSTAPRTFTTEETRLLTGLANLAAIAIENTRLQARARQGAILQERDRIAAELHDQLAQTLNYLSFKATVANQQLSDGQIDQAHTNLVEMKELSRQTLIDVREAIFSLRAEVISPELLVTLQEYIADYCAHYGMDVQLVVENGHLIHPAADVQIQILRIVQEALANVRKHSGKSKVWVRMSQVGDQSVISVEDDGEGFDANLVEGGANNYFGLKIMRERAESVGGTLELDTRPGAGTRVVLRIPSR